MTERDAKRRRLDRDAATPMYLAVDIELRGPALHHPVVALGVYLGPVDGHPMKGLPLKRRWAIQPLPGQTDDPMTMHKFWSKHPDVDEWVRLDAQPAYEVMTEFKAWCNAVVEMAGADGRITLVSDCADVDLARLDHLGHVTGAWDMPIRWLGGTVRHEAVDPWERMEQLGPVKGITGFNLWLDEIAPKVKHTHFPDDDAEYCYYQQLYVDRMRGTN